MKCTFIMLILFVTISVLGCTSTDSDNKAKTHSELLTTQSDSIKFPYVMEKTLEQVSYLISIDSIPSADGIKLQYRLRNEQEGDIFEDTYVTHYKPIHNGDYVVSTILMFHSMIEPQGCAEITPTWSDQGLLSEMTKDETERRVFEIYQKIRCKPNR